MVSLLHDVLSGLDLRVKVISHSFADVTWLMNRSEEILEKFPRGFFIHDVHFSIFTFPTQYGFHWLMVAFVGSDLLLVVLLKKTRSGAASL